jgi:vancomycin resistance protein YoaR
MKKVLVILSFLFVLVSCNKAEVPKPKKLIDEEVLENIIYDLTLLEAVKTQVAIDKLNFSGKTNDYIYKKYKVDSLQFVKSNQYYATDIDNYKKIFERVKDRLKTESEKLGIPKVDESEGVVK